MKHTLKIRHNIAFTIVIVMPNAQERNQNQYSVLHYLYLTFISLRNLLERVLKCFIDLHIIAPIDRYPVSVPLFIRHFYFT